jgi:hypothetical protein
MERNVINMVQTERKMLPMLGGKKIYHQIKPILNNSAIKMGRDKLFRLLSAHNLLINLRRRYVTTTNSKHWLGKYPNIIKDKIITEPEQLWVSDITYIKQMKAIVI